MDELVDTGVYWHVCRHGGCERTVQYDDEPNCFEHSPDSGSSVPGFSARRLPNMTCPKCSGGAFEAPHVKCGHCNGRGWL